MAVSYGYPPHKDSTKGQDGEFNDGKVGTKEFIKKEYIDLWFKPLVKGKQKKRQT